MSAHEVPRRVPVPKEAQWRDDDDDLAPEPAAPHSASVANGNAPEEPTGPSVPELPEAPPQDAKADLAAGVSEPKAAPQAAEPPIESRPRPPKPHASAPNAAAIPAELRALNAWVTAREAAESYIERGLHPIPIPTRSKKPLIKDWPTLRLTKSDLPRYFNGAPSNIGVILGDEYGTADVDLDCKETIWTAFDMLPETGMVFGRQSKPRSHHFYRCDPPVPTRRYLDPVEPDREKACLVELRCQKTNGDVGLQTVVPPSLHDETGEQIRFERAGAGDPANVDALVLQKAVARVAGAALLARYWPGEKSGRNEAFIALAGVLARAGWSLDDAIRFHRAIYRVLWGAKADLEAAKAEVAATYGKHNGGFETTGRPKLETLVDRRAIYAAFAWMEIPQAGGPTWRTEAAAADWSNPEPIEHERWPDPLAPAALYGIAGEIVSVVSPHSEADPVALLTHTLVSFGAMVGRAPHFVVGGTTHHANLYCVNAGDTASRKGQAKDDAFFLIRTEDSDFFDKRVQGGLSSGEGFIWAVRDPIEEQQPIKEKGRVVDYQAVTTDAGVEDKRLLLVEPEFASVLRVLEREGNTLSTQLRQGWESGSLRTMTKNKPARATGAYISILGHITPEELMKYLTETEQANGFANRFLWVLVRRSKSLPDGGQLHLLDLADIRGRLGAAVRFARTVGEVRRSDAARDIWHAAYGDLSNEKHERLGLFGAVTARASAQTGRLALIYALLDCSTTVEERHLKAALAVWKYCEDSARLLFGNSLGDASADGLLKALRAAPNGLTRAEMSNHFGRNRSAAELGRALGVLIKRGLVRSVRADVTFGRPAERWFAAGAPDEINEINERRADV